MSEADQNRYDQIIAEIFRRHRGAQKEVFEFHRDEMAEVCRDLGIERPKNLGDIIYTFRYRRELPRREQFPHLVCRPVSTQFMADDTIAMFELVYDGGEVEIREEKHYRLVSASEISAEELEGYQRK